MWTYASLRLAGTARVKQRLCRPSAMQRATISASTAALQVSRNFLLFSCMFTSVFVFLHPHSTQLLPTKQHYRIHFFFPWIRVTRVTRTHSQTLQSLSVHIFFKIQPGRVWTSALSYASSVQGSTETWGPTCHASAPWTSMIFLGSLLWFYVPSATTWWTAYGRAAQWAAENQPLMLHGKKHTLRNVGFDYQPPMLRTFSAFVFCVCSEERESWIRAKYEQKLFVAPLPPPTPGEGPDITLSGRLLLAVMEHNLPKLLLLLAHCTKEDINGPLSRALSSRSLFALRLPGSALHAACQQGDVVVTQLLLWVREIFQHHNRSTTECWNTMTIIPF